MDKLVKKWETYDIVYPKNLFFSHDVTPAPAPAMAPIPAPAMAQIPAPVMAPISVLARM